MVFANWAESNNGSDWNGLASFILTLIVRLLNPCFAPCLSGTAPPWRHIREFAYRGINLDHAAKANEFEVFGIESCSAKELPITVTFVIDLAHWLVPLQDLPSGKHARVGRQVELPGQEYM